MDVATLVGGDGDSALLLVDGSIWCQRNSALLLLDGTVASASHF